MQPSSAQRGSFSPIRFACPTMRPGRGGGNRGPPKGWRSISQTRRSRSARVEIPAPTFHGCSPIASLPTSSATCISIALEVLTGPPSGRALDRDWDDLWRHLQWLPPDEAIADRSLELLRGLAHTTDGAHRRRPIDYLVAACAGAAADVVLWPWDRDLVAICEFAGIAHEAEHERAAAAGLS